MMRRTLRSRGLGIALAVVAVSVAIVAKAPAQTRTVADVDVMRRLTGEWVLALEPREAQQRIDRAAARATADMLPLVSNVAADTLRARNPLSRRFEVEATPSRIRVRFERAQYDTAPEARVRVPVPGEESESMEVVQLVRGETLQQIFTTDRGRRWNTMTPSEDGTTLTLEAVIVSSSLPEQMRYTLTYRRP